MIKSGWCLILLLSADPLTAGSIHGTVFVDAGGERVVPFGSAAYPVDLELRGPSDVKRVLTTTTGEFEFLDLPEGGAYELFATDPSAFPALIDVVSNICIGPQSKFVPLKLEFSRTPPDFFFPPSAELKGRISTPDGVSPRKISVRVFARNELIARVQTDRKGRFRVPDVPHYEYVTVVAEKPGSAGLRETFWYGMRERQTVHNFAMTSCGVAAGPPN